MYGCTPPGLSRKPCRGPYSEVGRTGPASGQPGGDPSVCHDPIPEPRLSADRAKRSFLAELKSRRVYRVAAFYVVAAFALLQGADIVLPAFDAPDWLFRALILVALAGLPFALTLAWAFDLTPDGITRAGSGAVITGPVTTLLLRSLVGVVAVAAIGAVTLMVWRATRVDPAADRNRIMVFPLVVSGATPVPRTVGEDVATMIGHALDGTGPLRWIDGWPLLDAEARDDVRRLPLRDAQQLAASRNCGLFVMGRVLVIGDSTEVLLELRDARGGEEVARGQASGLATDPWRVGLRAVSDLLPDIIPTTVPDVEAGFARRPPGAVARFLLGEASYRRARFQDALAHFTVAFEDDPTFALAAIRAAQAASWEHDVGAARDLIDAALGLDLRPRDRLFTEGVRAYLDGDAATAVRRLEGALALDSMMAVAWAQLGEVYRHLVPMAQPEGGVASAFERALAQDGSAAHVIYHVLEERIRQGDMERIGRLRDEFHALNPDPSLAAQITYMSECVAGGAHRIGQARLAQWSRDRPLDLLVAGAQLAVAGRQLPCAEAFYRALLIEDTASDGAWQGRQWASFVGLTASLAARNRLDEAVHLVDAAAYTDASFRDLIARTTFTPQGLNVRDAGDAVPPPEAAPPHARSDPLRTAGTLRLLLGLVHPAAASVARHEATVAASNAPWAGVTSIARLTLLGAWWIAAGDTAAAAGVESRIVELTGGNGSAAPVLQSFAAWRALARADTTAALDRLQSLEPRASREALAWGLTASLGLERLHLARLLLDRGETQRALELAESFDASAPAAYLYFLPASLQIRKAAADRLGQPMKSRQYSERLRALGWPADGPV